MESNLLKRLSQLGVLVGCCYLYDQLVAAVAAWARSVCCVSCGLEYIYIYKWIKYLLLIIMIMLFIFENAKTLFFFLFIESNIKSNWIRSSISTWNTWNLIEQFLNLEIICIRLGGESGPEFFYYDIHYRSIYK